MKLSGDKMETKAADAGIGSDDNKAPLVFGSTNLRRSVRQIAPDSHHHEEASGRLETRVACLSMGR